MARPAALKPMRRLHTSLDADLLTRLDLHLWSALESRVPHGAYQEFLTARITEWFNRATIDLAMYIPGIRQGAYVVQGTPASIARLHAHLTEGEDE